MELFKIIIFTALCVGSYAKIETEDGIMVITEDNFEEAIQNTYMLIEFYAPWCGSCVEFAPKYVDLAKNIKEHNPDIKVGKVDTTVSTELSKQNNIRSYPTLRLFRDGVPINYIGDLEAPAVMDWLARKAGPPTVEIKSIRGAKRFIDNNEMVVIGFFKDFESADAEIYWQVANALGGDYEFGITNNEKLFKEFKAKDGQVIFFKKFDEGQNVYKKKMDAQKLQEFIEESSVPYVIDYDSRMAQKIFDNTIKDFLFVFFSEDNGDYDKYAEEFTKTAKKYRGKMSVVTVNVDIRDHSEVIEFFGVKDKDVPTMRIVKMIDRGAHKYKPESSKITDQSVYEFAYKYFAGELKRYLAAEDVPKDWDAKPVKVLTGKNFKKIAMDKSKHVLVEFYAPWCGHCKQLAPIYDELGEKYENNKNVVIAKIDATANEIEDVNVSGFPTIILFKKGTNQAINFDGNRTLEGMSKFIDSDGVEGAKEEEEEEDEENIKDEL